MTKSRIQRDNLGDLMNEKLAWVDNEGRQVSKEAISQSKYRGYNVNKGMASNGQKKNEIKNLIEYVWGRKRDWWLSIFSIWGWDIAENRRGGLKLRQKLMISVGYEN